jgi:3-oxoacyl-[acyl-carrier-protein] synthase III
MMTFNNVVIAHIEDSLSEESYSSDFIEKQLAPTYDKLKLPEGRLELMTGIKERRFWPVGTKPSDLSTNVATKLIERCQVDKNDIGLLIHASVCRDFLEPSTASVVHHNLGLNSDAMIFDLSNACLGMMNAMVMAANMIESGQIKTALIVSGENGKPLVEETIKTLNAGAQNGTITRKNIKSYIANLTIGSAATAMLLGHHNDFPHAPKLKGGVVATDSSANHLCQGDGDRHQLMMKTDSEALMKQGVTLAQLTWKKLQASLSVDKNSFDWVLTHQVGKAHEELTLKTLGLEHLPTFRTYPYLGNTGSSALPITLSHLQKTGDIKKGHRLNLMGIGSGLTSLMLEVQW